MRRKRQWVRLFLIATLGLGVALGVIWLTFHHRPGWYRPLAADEPTIHLAQAESARVVEETSRQIVARQEFEIRLTDRMVNQWLAALPVLWPEAREWLPREARDPAVAFDDNEMRVGVHVDRDGWRVIANVSITARISKDMSSISVSLRGVRGGSLPLPTGVVQTLWQRVVANLRRGTLEGVELLQGQDGALELAVRNRFLWPNGQRPFRITRLGAVDGVLTIGMEPL